MNYGKRGVQKKQQALNSKSIKVKKMFIYTVLKGVLVVVLAVGIIGLVTGIGIFKSIIDSAPDISTINVTPSGYATTVYNCEGREISKLVATNSNRKYVTMEEIPEDLAHAFVAIEDARFYQHNGIDIKGILRAFLIGIKNKDFSEGASTITQQLLKNNVFEGWVSEKSFGPKVKRKIQEQYLAIELSKTMEKDEILELYMNSINLGQNTLGVQTASLRYFGKPVYQLNLSECAVIAAITQNPTKYNPISKPEKNAERREKVLGDMLEQEYISQAEYDIAMNDDVYSRIKEVNQDTEDNSINTYFVDELTEQVLNDLTEKLGYNETQAYYALFSSGLSIYSTQDPAIQQICDEVTSNEENYPANALWYLNYDLSIQKANGEVENHSKEMLKEFYKAEQPKFDLLYASKEEAQEAIDTYKESVLKSGDEVIGETINLTPQPQISVTVQDQQTGHVVAMVGGRGMKEGSRTLNRASNTVRQPGSTFKVVSTYAPALDSAGLTLATVFNDAPYNYENGRPVSNWYGNNYKGLCSLRYGIEQSLNIIAVKTLTKITPQLGFDYLQSFGFTTLVERRKEKNGKIVSDITQSTALGGITDGVTNMELNASYATIANHGTYIKPTLYTKIVDHNNNVLIDNTQPESRQVIKETTAYLLTDAMVDVVTKGTGGSVNFGGMAIAGKTGTTTDYRDVWFSGFTPYYTATTWAGYDNNAKMKSSAEKALAKSLWRGIMSKIHADLANKSFDTPSGIVTATICSLSGKVPIPGLCSTLKTEYFADGTVPTVSCDVHYQGMLCVYTGKPATELCPFKAPGTLQLLPNEGLSSSTSSVSPEGTVIGQNPDLEYCIHDELFFQNPAFEMVIQQQNAEILQREAAAAATLPPADPAAVPPVDPAAVPPVDPTAVPPVTP